MPRANWCPDDGSAGRGRAEPQRLTYSTPRAARAPTLSPQRQVLATPPDRRDGRIQGHMPHPKRSPPTQHPLWTRARQGRTGRSACLRVGIKSGALTALGNRRPEQPPTTGEAWHRGLVLDFDTLPVSARSRSRRNGSCPTWRSRRLAACRPTPIDLAGSALDSSPASRGPGRSRAWQAHGHPPECRQEGEFLGIDRLEQGVLWTRKPALRNILDDIDTGRPL